jgi:hypothetical protein
MVHPPTRAARDYVPSFLPLRQPVDGPLWDYVVVMMIVTLAEAKARLSARADPVDS